MKWYLFIRFVGFAFYGLGIAAVAAVANVEPRIAMKGFVTILFGALMLAYADWIKQHEE